MRPKSGIAVVVRDQLSVLVASLSSRPGLSLNFTLWPRTAAVTLSCKSSLFHIRTFSAAPSRCVIHRLTGCLSIVAVTDRTNKRMLVIQLNECWDVAAAYCVSSSACMISSELALHRVAADK